MTNQSSCDFNQLPAKRCHCLRLPLRIHKQQLLSLSQVIRQNANRKPERISLEVAAGHLFHPEPNLEFLDEVLGLSLLIMKPNNFFRRKIVPAGGDHIVTIAARLEERKLGIAPALDNQAERLSGLGHDMDGCCHLPICLLTFPPD